MICRMVKSMFQGPKNPNVFRTNVSRIVRRKRLVQRVLMAGAGQMKDDRRETEKDDEVKVAEGGMNTVRTNAAISRRTAESPVETSVPSEEIDQQAEGDGEPDPVIDEVGGVSPPQVEEKINDRGDRGRRQPGQEKPAKELFMNPPIAWYQPVSRNWNPSGSFSRSLLESILAPFRCIALVFRSPAGPFPGGPEAVIIQSNSIGQRNFSSLDGLFFDPV